MGCITLYRVRRLFGGRGETFGIWARQLLKAGSEGDVSGGKWEVGESGEREGESY